MQFTQAAGLAAGLFSVAPLFAADNFNPKISLILQGTAATFSEDEGGELAGILAGPETELRPEGLSLSETELSLEANVDDKLRAWATVAFENEDGETVVAVEEAYGETLSLPGGTALKFGRFFSEIGYHNRQHSHAWDFVDAPLPYKAFLANTLKDDGLQLRWLAPTDLFLELGGELLRGDAYPGGGENEDGINAYTLFGHLGGDFNVSSSWRLGLSYLNTESSARRSGEEDEDGGVEFFGDSALLLLDAVYKWAPNGDSRNRNLVLQAEFFQRRSDGSVEVLEGDNSVATGLFDSDGFGFYVQAAYQFMPRWRIGLRYDQLRLDNDFDHSQDALLEALDDSHDPHRSSIMLDYSPSEFSRFRVQYNRDDSSEQADDQLFAQYILSIGAHPAHQF